MPKYGSVCVVFSWCIHSLLSVMHHHNYIQVHRCIIIKVYCQGVAKFIGVLVYEHPEGIGPVHRD